MHKTSWIVAAAVMVAVGGAAPGVAGDEAAPSAPATTNVIKKQTMCPVMGGEVNKKLFVDYQGKRVYVCCRDCIGEVKKDPEKYIKKLEAEGITLDKAEPAKAKDVASPKAEDNGRQH